MSLSILLGSYALSSFADNNSIALIKGAQQIAYPMTYTISYKTCTDPKDESVTLGPNEQFATIKACSTITGVTADGVTLSSYGIQGCNMYLYNLANALIFNTAYDQSTDQSIMYCSPGAFSAPA